MKNLWWLSFADDEGFRGACVVDVGEDDDFLQAVMISHSLGINPGGQVLGDTCPPTTPEDMIGVLFKSKKDAEVAMDRITDFYNKSLS